jgi:hypothetical protein
MSDETDRILFACTQCGSKNFIFPNQPPKDDDIISCSGCKRDIGRYDVIRDATTTAAKAEVDKIVANVFGKKPTRS